MTAFSQSQLEKKLILLFHDSGDLEFPEEDWVFEVCPELNDLEADTLDALLAQAQQHARYERAARDLLVQERLQLEETHERELRSLRAEYDAEQQRKVVGQEERIKGLEAGAEEDLEELRQEATDKIQELEGVIEGLEEQLEAQKQRVKEVEEAAEAECEQMRERSEAIIERLEAAQQETDLKRETQRKLKEEIIDNDRLTLANLNRIKALEQLVEEQKAALAEADGENEQLREELSKSMTSTDAEEEVTALRELLEERESQLMTMSHRLSDVLSGNSENTRRRDSFIDRLPFKSFANTA